MYLLRISAVNKEILRKVYQVKKVNVYFTNQYHVIYKVLITPKDENGAIIFRAD